MSGRGVPKSATLRSLGRGADTSRDQPGMKPKVGRRSAASPRLKRGRWAKKRAKRSDKACGGSWPASA